jgi:hypothetical protein
MTTRRFTTFGLFAALICISAFVSCKQQLATYTFKSDRLVTIQVSPDDPKKCDADFPVTFMRVHDNNKVGWASDDNAYTVHFVGYTGGPSPQNPFNPTLDTVQVPAGGKSPLQKLQNRAAGYYRYEILDANNNRCKKADDDHDTGLNIKP